MARPAKLIARNRSEYGQAAVDLYTPLHFALGFGAGVYGVSPVKAALFFTVLKLAIASAEHGMGHALMRRVPGESNINEICDLLAEIGGVDVGAKLRTRWNPSPTIPVVDPAPTPVVAAPVAGIFR